MNRAKLVVLQVMTEVKAARKERAAVAAAAAAGVGAPAR